MEDFEVKNVEVKNWVCDAGIKMEDFEVKNVEVKNWVCDASACALRGYGVTWGCYAFGSESQHYSLLSKG